MPQFNFQFGKKKPNKKNIIIVSIVLSAVVTTLSQCTGTSQKNIWDILDEVQRNFFPQSIINDIFLQDQDIIKRRVERDVNKAIKDYEDLTKDSEPPRVPLPIFTEKERDNSLCYSEECKKLGGELRLCSPWITDCIIESND
jgi:hypothetical protein